MIEQSDDGRKQKQEVNQLIDSFISTLVNEFGETEISNHSPRKEKVQYLKKLS